MPHLPDREATVAATASVLQLVHTACDNWRFPSNLNHATSTACMARAAELIEEALRLAEHPPTVGGNILVRSAFECWLVGVWALFGGNDALLGIEKERARNERLLASSVGLGDRTVQYIERQQQDIAALAHELLGSDAPSSVKYEQIATALPPQIKEQTRDHEDVNVLTVYNLLYRSHSTYDSHPWKVVGQYLSGDGWRIESPGPWQDPLVSAALMTMYVGVLGRWIEQARGHDSALWDEAVARLEGVLRVSP